MPDVNSVVADSLASILAINTKIERLNEEAKTERQKALAPFLEALAKSGEVSAIIVRGYTPGFNDGEPCEHSADVFVNIEEIYGEDLQDTDAGGNLPEELFEELSYGSADANRELCTKFGHVYDKPSAEIMNAIRTLIFATAEEENSTNYFLSYVLKDGKFEIASGEYDCGY
ncbi:hypothetical protein [Ancylobacter rudongensis]|uniref:Uncharacterized protein n=1 Tax=Ancylobacter rudongensis TaxID=177413 RepID=A0A1G4UNX3_9HYPH|nr:hypothetical protein [Ancylobacter rudongensis]SCW95366.1 hypothetical protein SAMN05660859_0010 [Ancylobacter rudongensis]